MDHHHKWLQGQLEGWVKEGLITPESADQLRRRFPSDPHAGARFATMVFGLFGGLLVGAGIITLIAYNWDQFGRGSRALVAFIPLLAAQGLAVWMRARGEQHSAAWREGVAAFYVTALGAGLSIISQTYQTGEDLTNLTLKWTLLILPVVYLLSSHFAALAYLVGISAWILVTDRWQEGLWYFPLLALAVPFGIARFRQEAHVTGGLTVLLWVAGISVHIGILKLMSDLRDGGGLIPLSIALISCLFILISRRFNPREERLQRRPLLFLGGAANVVMAFAFTFEPLWDAPEFSSGPALLLLALILLPTALLAIDLANSRQFAPLIYLGLPAILIAGMASGKSDFSLPGMILCNAYLFGLALVNIMRGRTLQQTGPITLGVALLAGLLCVRFFDSDLPLLVKATAFIIIGIGFLVLNLTLLNPKRHQPA